MVPLLRRARTRAPSPPHRALPGRDHRRQRRLGRGSAGQPDQPRPHGPTRTLTLGLPRPHARPRTRRRCALRRYGGAARTAYPRDRLRGANPQLDAALRPGTARSLHARCCRAGRVARTAPRTRALVAVHGRRRRLAPASGANGRSSRSRGESAHRSQGSSSPPRRSPCTLPRSRPTNCPPSSRSRSAIGAASALANNLPVSASATALLAAGPAAYAASIGLAVGALATPQGSVATLIATDLAGPNAPPLPLRRLAPLAVAAVLIATLVLWTTLRV